MKITNSLVGCALLVASGQVVNAQTAVLLKDINTTTAGIPSSPTKGVWMGSNYYFAATNGINGVELWKTDGTTGNTIMLKDINAGNGSSSPASLVVVGTTVYFAANDGVNGNELWKTDGTAAGTVLVKDIQPGPDNSSPSTLVQMGSYVVFNANESTTGDELWRSDGTAAGTVVIKEIITGYIGGGINRITTTGTKVYFGASSTPVGNYELFKTDGTVGGTGLVKEIDPSSLTGGMAGATYAWGENLYFGGSDGTNGTELWKSDGTTAGTVMVKDIYTGSTSSLANAGNPSNFCAMNGKLYFTGNDANGAELWVTDGTAGGTVMVKDINPGSGASQPSRMLAVGSTLYFRATDGTNGTELWKSDGTSGGTVMVKDVSSGSTSSNPDQLTVIGTTLYFQANDNVNGVELWKSDGTGGGTVLVKDIYPGATGSAITNMTTNGSILVFSADNGTNGAELYKSDGTGANTTLLKNINPDNGNSAIAGVTALGSKVVFAANDGVNGTEVWGTDGTVAGTMMLADINTSTAGASGAPLRFTKIGSNLLFSATNGTTTGLTGNELYKTDGTVAGTGLLKDISTGTGSSNPRNFTEQGGYLYFSAADATNGNELWRSDGTAANTVLVKDIVSGSGNSSPGGSGTIPNMASTGTMLFFAALNQTAGQETGIDLYGSTGAIGNGGLIKDINVSSFAANSAPSNFAYPGTGTFMYFQADDGVNGMELWKSDGTLGGTSLVKDVTPGAGGTTFGRLTAYGNKVYFTAYNATAGTEMWVTDGTSAGTVVFKDINPGINSAAPQNLTVCGSYLYFSADDGTSGRELWRTDGTSGGTVMVSDIVSGSGSSNPANFFWHTTLQSVFFSAYTPANGVELWEYDGTSSRLYTEVVAGAGSSNPGPIMLAGNNLVFVGTNGTNGLELYGVETYNSWDGSNTSVWSTAANWKKNLVPGTTESALLPPTGVTNEAALDVNATVVRLEVGTGRILTLNASRTLTVSDLVFNYGTIKGTGTLANANFINTGTIAPGNSPGILNITGNFTNQGTLQMELGNTTVGTGYDRLAVSGGVTLGGTLALSQLSGFTLTTGQVYTVVTGASLSGTFSSVTWPGGVTGTVGYTGNSVTVTIGTVLPLSLVNFTAHARGETAVLNWETASEKNTKAFEIERSIDGKKFSFIQSVAAIGTGANRYEDVDFKPVAGNNYYRLKMIDVDGAFEYSKVAMVSFRNESDIRLIPVPAKDYIEITFDLQTLGGQQAAIYSMTGELVQTLTLKNGMRLDISGMASGMYTFKTGAKIYKFVKQ
jgi:ELWxxDGT repeat protein